MVLADLTSAGIIIHTLESARRNAAALIIGSRDTWRQMPRRYHEIGATYAAVMSDWPLEQKVVPYLRARRLLS